MTAGTSSFDLTAADGQLALKREATMPARLAETLVAFANAAGGTLLVGVDPRSGQPQGLADPEGALDRTLEAALSADPPLVIPLPQVVEMERQQALAVTVPPGLPQVYSYKGRTLICEGRHNRLLDPSQLRRLMMARGAASFEALAPTAPSWTIWPGTTWRTT